MCFVSFSPLLPPALVAHELNLRRGPGADELNPGGALRTPAVALDVRPPVALIARNHGPAQLPAHEAVVVVDILPAEIIPSLFNTIHARTAHVYYITLTPP